MECSADIFGVEIQCRQKVHDIAEERTALPVVAIANHIETPFGAGGGYVQQVGFRHSPVAGAWRGGVAAQYHDHHGSLLALHGMDCAAVDFSCFALAPIGADEGGNFLEDAAERGDDGDIAGCDTVAAQCRQQGLQHSALFRYPVALRCSRGMQPPGGKVGRRFTIRSGGNGAVDHVAVVGNAVGQLKHWPVAATVYHQRQTHPGLVVIGAGCASPWRGLVCQCLG